MNSSRLLLVLLCTFCALPVFSQIDLKLQLMPDGSKWGVYAVPAPIINPSSSTITGSGQITIVAPLNFTMIDLTPVSGNWNNNATINGPSENPNRTYLSIGLVADNPPIIYSNSAPTLLFTFKKPSGGCPDDIHIFDNITDPFNVPNSLSTNPGNELTIFDVPNSAIYEYGKNLAPYAWDCHDCDNDGIANALEDTNGDGLWTPGIDVSDLCNGAGGSCVEITGAALRCSTGGTACGNQPTGPLMLAIDISGGLAPFTIKYKTGTTVLTLNNYQSGTAFQVPATNGALYELVEVKGADGCISPTEGLTGQIPVSVAGTLQFTVQPASVSLCNGLETLFPVCATATNASFKFNWQYSTDNGTTWEPVPMGINFNQANPNTMTSGCDTLYVGTSIGLNGYKFRAVAAGNNLATTYSNIATISLAGTPQATQHPQNQTVCAGQSAIFTAGFQNGAGLSLQWQTSTNGGTTWTNLASNGNYSGTTTPTLTIQSATAALNNQLFRLKAQAGTCPATYTQVAFLSVLQISINSQLIYNPTVCRGTEACLEVAVDAAQSAGLTYQWQERVNGTSDWVDIVGASTSILCLSNTNNIDGNCYRAQINSTGCQPSISPEGCITVEGEAVIATQPQNQTKCFGESAQLTANATIANGLGGNLTYQWQISTDQNQTWSNLGDDANISGSSTNMLTIQDPALTQGQLFRLAAKAGSCGAAYSEAAQVYVEGPIVITQQPQALSVCNGASAVLTTDFYAANTGNPDSEIAIRWQVSYDGGATFEFVEEDGNHFDIYSLQLTVQQVTSKRMYRLFFQYPTCDPVYSDAVAVDVFEPAVFTQQPVGTTVCGGEAVTLQANATGDNLSYHWVAIDNSGAITTLTDDEHYAGTTTNTLLVKAASQSLQYQLQVKSNGCAAVASALTNLIVEQPIVFSLQPYSQAVCPSESVIFSANTVGALPGNLQWQMSTNGVWTDIAEGGNFTGTQTATLHLASAAGLDGAQFRLVAASQACSSTSEAASLNLIDEIICNPIEPEKDCIKLSVKLLGNQQGWGVWAKADNDFTVTPYQLPTGGKITLVAPVGFTFTNFTNIAGGKWKFGKAIMNPSQDPGKIYMEFNLTPNHNFLNLEPGGEIMLFRFDHVGPCPSSLRLMDEIVPPGFYPNEFTGFGAADNDEIPFHFCGNYAQDQWNCPSGWNLVGPGTDGLNDLEGQDVEVELSSLEVPMDEIAAQPESSFFGVAPNPTQGDLLVSLDENIASQPAMLRLWNMQGQLLMTERTEGTSKLRLDISQKTVPGTYFLTLEVNGKVVQREKIIRN
ncbi:MAG: T9SS type A sorting domain-containing protein [Saprospiraceae bacterium]|nr:T9SS type A sorting domain-containing protein [Saprospiraceae bacterium]